MWEDRLTEVAVVCVRGRGQKQLVERLVEEGIRKVMPGARETTLVHSAYEDLSSVVNTRVGWCGLQLGDFTSRGYNTPF